MIHKELMLFIIIGILTICLDYVSYYAILMLLHPSLYLAKASGFITGSLFSYLANRFLTFSHNHPAPGSLIRFSLVYIATLFINVITNNLIYNAMTESIYALQIAFIVSTFISASINFIGMKLFAFKEQSIEVAR